MFVPQDDLPGSCPDAQVLRKWLQDELSEEGAAPIEEHVAACPFCQRAVDRLGGELPCLLYPPTQRRDRFEDEEPPDLEGYELPSRIAAGGMGVVWRVRDLQFQRPLAIKVMKASARDNPKLARRFLVEARITGQLAHPFIVPIHALGRLPDGRFYYTMKLVEGKTLDELLRDRPGPESRQTDWVQVFAQVCQAVAFAHERGIIHRDLKPANVMVGKLGEVQVMDWGLGKELAGTGPLEGEPDHAGETVDEAWHDTDNPTRTGDVLGTLRGDVLGTLQYMPPESAAGLVAEVDKRSDVFGLGAILCEILTGKRPYTSEDVCSVRLEATEARLDGALGRLRSCGAEPDLIRLAERCLAPRKSERPADAGEVEAAVKAHQAAAQERLQQERMERERQQVKAEEERRRRKLWAGLTAALLVAFAAVAACALVWQDVQARRRADLAQARIDLRDAERLVRARRFAEAKELLTRARDLLGTDGPTELQNEHGRLQGARQLANELERIQFERTNMTSKGLFDNDRAQRGYRDAFDTAGLGPVGKINDSPAKGPILKELVEKINDSPVKGPILEALDNWALICAYDMEYDPEHKDQHKQRRDWLLELARAADPDPNLRDRIRTPQHWENRQQLEELARLAAPQENLAPQLASLLAEVLRRAGGDPELLLRTFQARHRESFWLNYDLGKYLAYREPAEALRFLQAALAGRPRHTAVLNWVGGIYLERGDLDRAIPLFEEVVTLDPEEVAARDNLAEALILKGRPEEAIKHYLHVLDGGAREPIVAHALARLLKDQGDCAEAAKRCRSALTWLPEYMPAGPIVIDGKEVAKKRLEAPIRVTLGDVLVKQNEVEKALQEYRTAVRLWPGFIDAHRSLGALLASLGKRGEALKELDRAIDCSPNQERLTLRAFRAVARVRAGMEAEAVAEVAELTAPGTSTAWTAGQRYNFACVYAVASSKVASRKQEYEDRAMQLLSEAVRAGWRDAAHMAQDSDLKPLCGREDFKRLVDSLPKPKPG
jgi:serine/threonine-protein kinase